VHGLSYATLRCFDRLLGSGDTARTDANLGALAILLLGLSALVGVGGWLASGWLLAVLDTPPEIIAPAQAFLRINFAGTVFLVGYNFIGTLLRAFGNSRTPLYFVILATVLAGVLAPLLINGLGMGVEGAAWAMVLAQGAAFVYS